MFKPKIFYTIITYKLEDLYTKIKAIKFEYKYKLEIRFGNIAL